MDGLEVKINVNRYQEGIDYNLVNRENGFTLELVDKDGTKIIDVMIDMKFNNMPLSLDIKAVH